VTVFTVVCGGLLAFFVLVPLALGVFSKRSVADVLDWRPTRPPAVEAENELDDVAQMIAAQNEIRARRGMPPRTQEDVELQLARDRAEMQRWRES
jgi:hypothetical protein